MPRKTERLSAHAGLEANTHEEAVKSFSTALSGLENEANAQGREILFDTIDISVERDYTSEASFLHGPKIVATYVMINVTADAVLRSMITAPSTEQEVAT